MVILTIISDFLKIFLEFFKLYISWAAEEKATKLRRIDTYMKSILDTVVSNTEFLDETAYFAGISQEKRVRYQYYHKMIMPILLVGGGINEISELTDMGFQLRFTKVKDKVISILVCGQSAPNRSKLIAKEVVDASIT